MAKVVWRPQAVDDIRQIVRYVAQHNPDAALNIAARLFALGESLKDFPRRGRPSDDYRELTTVPPYILRYVVEHDTVFILSVRHGARNSD